MRCPERHILQAYIDGELDLGPRKKLEAHLGSCSGCGKALDGIRKNDDLVFSKVNAYRESMESAANAGRIPPYIAPDAQTGTGRKGVYDIMNKYKKLTVAAVLCVAITSCIAIQPVRSAISNALSIFRMQDIKGINISLKDIQDLQEQIQSKQPEIKMDKFGSIRTTGGQQHTSTPEEVKKLQDFKALLPPGIDTQQAHISTTDPLTIAFTLNVGNVNSAMRTLGATKLLPENVDGKTFSADIPKTVQVNWEENGAYYSIIETTSPKVTVPEGVDLDKMYEALGDIPILPGDIKRQIRSIKDWKSTLYVPVVESKGRQVDINGSSGYAYHEDNMNSKQHYSWIIWKHGNLVIGMQSNTDIEGIVNMARSLK